MYMYGFQIAQVNEYIAHFNENKFCNIILDKNLWPFLQVDFFPILCRILKQPTSMSIMSTLLNTPFETIFDRKFSL